MSEKKVFPASPSCCYRWSGRPRWSSASWPPSARTTTQSPEAWRRSLWAWRCLSSACRWASTAATLSTLPGIWGLASSRLWQAGGAKFSREFAAKCIHPSIHSFIHSFPATSDPHVKLQTPKIHKNTQSGNQTWNLFAALTVALLHHPHSNIWGVYKVCRLQFVW